VVEVRVVPLDWLELRYRPFGCTAIIPYLYYTAMHCGTGVVMASEYVDAGDVDLDKEIVRREDGSRITEAEAAEQGNRIAERGGDDRLAPTIVVCLSMLWRR
jgi:hypothetical protein